MMNYGRLADGIADWLRWYMEEAGAEGYVVGLSGGVDSTTAAALAVRAVGIERVHGFLLPCDSSDAATVLGFAAALWLGILWRGISVSYVYDEFMRQCGLCADDVARGNVKARLRMTALYYYANRLNCLVLGTGNRSELMVGYFTKYGDGGVDVLPLGSLYKTEVWELARYLGVPERIISAVPSAGLWPGQTDEQELGMSYQELDAALRYLGHEIPDQPCSDEQLQHVVRLFRQSGHKCHVPPVYLYRREIVR